MGLFDLFKHKKSDDAYIEDEEEYEEDEESISVYDAADIWLANGKDEDYMFGYTWEELENASK